MRVTAISEESQVRSRTSRRLTACSQVLGTVAAVCGAVVFFGWAADVPELTSVSPILPSMKANTALGFVLLGTALGLYHAAAKYPSVRHLADLLAAAGASVGLLTLLQYVAGRSFGIDQLLFADATNAAATSHPGRMAPGTALVLFLYGSGVLLVGEKRATPAAQFLAGCGLLISLLGLLGYAYKVEELRGPEQFTQMALLTAVVAFALGLALILADPRRGPASIVGADTMGGMAARLLLPAAVVVPVLLGWLRVLGERQGLYEGPLGSAFFAISNVIVFVALVLLSAWSLHRVSLSRRLAEAESTRFKFISDHANDQHFLIDRQGALRYVNEVARAELGYSREELQHTTFHVIHPDPADAKTQIARFFEMSDEEIAAPIETAYVRKDGSRIPVSVSVTRVTFDDEPYLYAVARDISDLKAVQEELEDRNHILETINQVNTILAAELDLEKLVRTVTDAGTELVNAEFGAFFYNVEGDEGGAYMLYTLSGAPREAFEHFPMPRDTEVFHPTFSGESIVRADDITADPRYGKNPPYFGMPEGHLPVRSYLSAPVVSRTGEVLGGLFFGHQEKGIFDDRAERIITAVADQAAIAIENARLYASAQNEIVERRRAEKRLQELNDTLEHRVQSRTAELEQTNARLEGEISDRTRAERSLEKLNTALLQSNRELQEFAYAASHDLQEPLRKITAFADLLLVDCADTLVPSARQYVERMQHASVRMSRLIQDLLAFSRVSTQGRPYERVSLDRVVEQVLDDLTVAIQESGAVVDVGTLPDVDADPTQMRQLLQNLISNAVKFRSDTRPSRVWITSDESVSGNDGMRTVRVSVRDNGIGFDPRYADKVFIPFQRLHGQGRYPGTGIGLAICRRIVERHRGSIRVDSTPGVGSTFTFELPVVQESERDEPLPTSIGNGGGADSR